MVSEPALFRLMAFIISIRWFVQGADVMMAGSLDFYGSFDTQWTQYENNCYKYFPSFVGMRAAFDSCEANSAHLASVESENENIFISSLSFNFPRWLGGRVLDGEWQWWPQGSAIKWWPNDMSEHEDERCILLKDDMTWQLLVEKECYDVTMSYVCEKEWCGNPPNPTPAPSPTTTTTTTSRPTSKITTQAPSTTTTLTTTNTTPRPTTMTPSPTTMTPGPTTTTPRPSTTILTTTKSSPTTTDTTTTTTHPSTTKTAIVTEILTRNKETSITVTTKAETLIHLTSYKTTEPPPKYTTEDTATATTEIKSPVTQVDRYQTSRDRYITSDNWSSLQHLSSDSIPADSSTRVKYTAWNTTTQSIGHVTSSYNNVTSELNKGASTSRIPTTYSTQIRMDQYSGATSFARTTETPCTIPVNYPHAPLDINPCYWTEKWDKLSKKHRVLCSQCKTGGP